MVAAHALVVRADKRNLPPLIRLMRKGRSRRTRRAAAYALGFLGDSRGVDPLISCLEDEREPHMVRAMAAESLGELAQTLRRSETRRSVTPLLRALRDPSPDVRFWGCYALSEHRDRGVLPALRKLISDRAVPKEKGWWSVGAEARWAIAVLENDPRAEAIWRRNFRTANGGARSRVAKGRRSSCRADSGRGQLRPT